METPITVTLGSSEDQDEMPQIVAFHQDLHFKLIIIRQNQSSVKEIQYLEYNVLVML